MASIRHSWLALLAGLVLLGTPDRSQAQEESPPVPELPSLPAFWEKVLSGMPPLGEVQEETPSDTLPEVPDLGELMEKAFAERNLPLVPVASAPPAVELKTPVVRPPLTLTITGPELATTGEKVVFQVQASNHSDAVLKQVIVRAKLPPGLFHPEADKGQGRIDTFAFDLSPGETLTLPLETRATAPGHQVVEFSTSPESGTQAPPTSVAVVIDPPPDVRLEGPQAPAGGRDVEVLHIEVHNPNECTARNERALSEVARSYLEDQAYHSATATLEELLRCYPKSHLAAEATYQLGLVHLLQGKDDEARKMHEQVVEKYPASPWAKVVLAAHYDEESLHKLANARRLRAAETGRPEDGRAAVEVLELYAKRFPDGKMKKSERLYKLGVCQRLAGNAEAFRTSMEELREDHADSEWGKLAAYQLADVRAFEEGLEELFALSAEKEEQWALLDLAARYGPLPDPKRQVLCQALQARCLSQLGRNREAVALWESVLKEHPDAPEAPSCRFRLAEHYYQLGEVARARVEYGALAERYPNSPEAAVARRWAKWLDDHDGLWAEVEDLLAGWVRLADDFCQGFAGNAVLELPPPCPSVACRLAFRDAAHFLFRLEAGGGTFLLARNEEGGWLQSLDAPYVLRTKEPVDVPMPCVRCRNDLSSRTFKGEVFFTTRSATPSVTIPLDTVPQIISSLQQSAHLTRAFLPGPRMGLVYRLEWPAEVAGEVHSLEVEVDDDGRPRAFRGTWCAGNGRKTSCTLSDLVLGQAPPEDALEVVIPNGVAVRDTNHINVLQCGIELMKLVEKWFEKATGPEGGR
jgi:TolA-binding protein